MDNPPPMPPLPPPTDGPSQPPGSGPFAFPPPPDEAPGWGMPRGFYPLDLDDIVRNAWSLFRFAWPKFLGAALIPNLIVYAITIPVLASTMPQFNAWILSYRESVVSGRLPSLPPDLVGTVLLIILVSILGGILGGVVVAAAVIHLGDSIFRGRPVTIGSALSRSLRRLPALLGAGLLYGLAVFGVILIGFTFGGILAAGGGGAVFLGIVAFVASVAAIIFIAIRWSLMVQTIVIENQGAVEGLSRSWRLVAGSGWRVLGYAIFVAVIGGIFGAVITAIPELLLRLPPASTTGVIVSGIFQGLLTVLIAPLALITLFLYYDLRFKHGEPAPQPGEDRAAAQPVEG